MQVLCAGAKVSDTIRKGIIDIEPYSADNATDILLMGNLAALSGKIPARIPTIEVDVTLAFFHCRFQADGRTGAKNRHECDEK